MKRKNIKRKAGAFLLTLLTLSGGVAAVPLLSCVGELSCGELKSLSENSMSFVKAENLDLVEDLDYFQELNDYFAEKDLFDEGVDEDAIEYAIMQGDYESWKEEFVSSGGACDTGFISREEFEVLKELRKNKC